MNVEFLQNFSITPIRIPCKDAQLIEQKLNPLRGFWGCWETFIWILFSIYQLFHAIFDLRGVFLTSNSLHNLRGQTWSCQEFGTNSWKYFFSVECMVWLWCYLFQPLTTSKTIDIDYLGFHWFPWGFLSYKFLTFYHK